MGQFSVEKPVAPGSALSGNQQNTGFQPIVVFDAAGRRVAAALRLTHGTKSVCLRS